MVPRDSVFPPGRTDQQVQQDNADQFAASEANAEVAALTELAVPTRVVVGELVDGLAGRRARSQVGDELVAVSGRPVASPRGRGRGAGRHRAGPVGARSPTGGPGSSATPTWCSARARTARRGCSASGPGSSRRPATSTISLGDIGGPSAGLMFALAVVDKLTPGELTGGRFVAGTGTITQDGVVGPIGGIPFKMRAARDAGATEFLVPADNCAEAVANAPDGLQLLRVGTLARRRGRAATQSGRNRPAYSSGSRPEREPHTASVELWGQGVPSDRPPGVWVARTAGARSPSGRAEAASGAKTRIHGACAVAMRPPVGAPTLTRRTRILLVVAAILVLLLLGGSRLINFYVDWLWFGEVGFRDVFTTVLFTRIVQFLVGGLLIGGLVALSLWIAYRSRPVFVPVTGPGGPDRPVPHADHPAAAAVRDRHPGGRSAWSPASRRRATGRPCSSS